MVLLWLLVGAAPIEVAAQSREIAGAPVSRRGSAMEAACCSAASAAACSSIWASQRPGRRRAWRSSDFIADVHRNLSQWEMASSPATSRILEEVFDRTSTAGDEHRRPYAFLKGDFGTAIQHFQKVTVADPNNAAAQFNLSQAYSESYLFNESRKALARQIDDTQVDVWVRSLSQQRVVTPSGGLARIPEILEPAALHLLAGGASAGLDLFRRWLSLLVPVVLLLLSLALHLARRPFGFTEKGVESRRSRTGVFFPRAPTRTRRADASCG